MREYLKRYLCALLSVFVLMAQCGAAAVELRYLGRENVTRTELANAVVKYVYAYDLKVYDWPAKTTGVRETIPFAKQVYVLAEQKGWAKVLTTNDRVGFCSARQLTAENPNNMHRKVYSQHKEAEVFLYPSVDSPLISYLDRNEKATCVAMTPMGDWVRVKKGKYYGYIQRPRVDFEKYNKGTPMWVNKNSLTVYYDPEIDSVMAKLYFGQELYLVSAEEGKRAKVRNKQGLIGYCDFEALTDEDPNGLSQIVYTQVEGNYLFTSATDLSGRRNVKANEEMILVAVDNNNFWARVRYEEQYFYVPFIFLDGEQRLGDYKRVRTNQPSVLRSGTKQSSKEITTLPTGTDLWLVKATDNRAVVSTVNGKKYTGYIELKNLINTFD